VWSPVAQVPFLFGAGILAGIAGSSGAIGSLIAYPALLAVGLPARVANMTSTVAALGVAVGASARSRTELAAVRAELPRALLLACIGAGTGSALLLSTPNGAFRWIVPFLVAGAAVMMLVQPRLVRRHGLRPRLLPGGLLGTSAYEGYFGAGAGVLTLAVILLTLDRPLPPANAMKNLVLGAADLVGAVVFVVFGSVSWVAAVPLGLGFAAGGTVGPAIVRRTRPEVLRVVIAVAGLVLAVVLLVDATR
jgi:uncharacterized protein